MFICLFKSNGGIVGYVHIIHVRTVIGFSVANGIYVYGVETYLGQAVKKNVKLRANRFLVRLSSVKIIHRRGDYGGALIFGHCKVGHHATLFRNIVLHFICMLLRFGFFLGIDLKRSQAHQTSHSRGNNSFYFQL